jgi:hypothetical protein
MFDARVWNEARLVLGNPNLPADPRSLDLDARLRLADDLLDAGWTYRRMSSATAIPTTTLHRRLGPVAVVGPSRPKGPSGGWAAVGAIVGAALAAVSSGRRQNQMNGRTKKEE